MEKPRIEKLEDLIPVVRKHLVPHIEKAVDVCTRAYQADRHYNDNYTFGTHLWRNTWNRIDEIAKSGDTPIEPHGKGNEYKFKIGPFSLRHHRVGGEDLLPVAAKSAKYEAVQLNLFRDIYPDILPGDNIILAIEADPEEGLKNIFIGELKQDPTMDKFFWNKEVAIFTPEELSILKGDFISCPPEQEASGEVLYQPMEVEPGEIVSLDHETDIISKTKNGKTDV